MACHCLSMCFSRNGKSLCLLCASTSCQYRAHPPPSLQDDFGNRIRLECGTFSVLSCDSVCVSHMRSHKSENWLDVQQVAEYSAESPWRHKALGVSEMADQGVEDFTGNIVSFMHFTRRDIIQPFSSPCLLEAILPNLLSPRALSEIALASASALTRLLHSSNPIPEPRFRTPRTLISADHRPRTVHS